MKVSMKTPGKHNGKHFKAGAVLTLDTEEAVGWIARGLAYAAGGEDDGGENNTEDDRAALFAQAEALGLKPRSNTGTEKLIKMIDEALAGGEDDGGDT